MKAIQITIDESTLDEVDRRLEGQTRRRSAFIRDCIRRHLERLRAMEFEDAERRAYEQEPIRSGEFDVWDDVQVWPDE